MSIVERSERSLGLAGSIVRARYRVNAVASVSRDVVVYTAEELRFGRAIALKVLRDEVAADAEFVAAVREQATTLAMSAHVQRGLPRVYECGTMDNGELFVALEPTRGATLREVLDARGALDLGTALRLASQVGEALEVLHHDRIVHGELGPESVLLVRDDDGIERVVLLGVELTAAYRTPLGRRRREASPPAYLAPEQVEGGETTEATDQYALGMLLRDLLAGGRPREATGAAGASSALPPEVERIVATALEPRPERRFPDLSVMVNDLWAAQTALAEPAPAPPPRPARAARTRASSHRRHRRRRPDVALRIAAAVATAGIIAGLVWLALAGGLVARVRALVATPASTAVPALQGVAPAAREETAPSREAPPARDAAAGNGHADPAAAPRSAPAVERDGSAAIDWLLKRPR
jgi:serine/threonine-protein kinase